MLLAELLGRRDKTDAEKAHDAANDEMAMFYNSDEETDLALHAKSDNARHRYVVTSFRSVKDWQDETSRVTNRIFFVLVVMVVLELLHKDGAASLLLQLAKLLATP